MLLLPLALAVSSCFWSDEYNTRQLAGNYYLSGVSAADPWYSYFDDEVGLAAALINARIAEAGFNAKCIVLRAATTGTQFYVIPLGRPSDVESLEEVGHKNIGPLSKVEFQTTVRWLNNGVQVPFDPELTSF